MKWPFRRRSEPAKSTFRGTPAIRRVKQYAADTGHTYSYWYKGWRAAQDAGCDYFFACRRGPSGTFELCVRLLESNLNAVAEQIGRHLTNAEQYAVVKLALFRAFDEEESLDALGQPFVPTRDQLMESLNRLGRL